MPLLPLGPGTEIVGLILWIFLIIVVAVGIIVLIKIIFPQIFQQSSNEGQSKESEDTISSELLKEIQMLREEIKELRNELKE